jgi:penicillin-binding protein 2
MAFLIRISEKSLRASRARWLTVIAVTGLLLCFLRLVDLQIIRGRTLAAASENNHTQILVEHAPRGRILDRKGKVLADNQPVFVAFFSPLGLSAADLMGILDKLSPIVEVDRTDLEHRLMAAMRAKTMLRVSNRLTRDQAFLILQSRAHLPGVSLTIEEQRFYPEGKLASHVLGYVGQITDDELDQFADKGYHAGDWIGKTGLERLYDPLLQGQDGGFLMEVDALGRQVRILQHLLPQPGKDLHLTLDRDVEELAEKRLKETGHPGAAVVLNPQTGELLALASSPGFDPNSFLPSGKSGERSKLLNDPDLPLYNRAIQALYPPGSIFKIVTAMAELEQRAMETDERVHCTGSYTIGSEKRIFHCWQLKGHGWVNFERAMAQSCDVYFYQVGLKLGYGMIEKYAQAAGLGQRSGVDLPSEKKGLLPVDWKKRSNQHWQGGDTLNYAIGQGALQVTPLQMADVAALVANQGVIYQPYLAAESRRFGEESEKLTTPHELLRVTVAKRTWKVLRDALEEVVRSGTGAAAQIPGIAVAGKTGTAQATKGKEHAWFVSYAPADDAKIACAVVVEHGGHGGAVAAPIAHDLLALAIGATEKAVQKSVSETQADC